MRKLEKGSADTFLLAAAETDEEEARASAASDGFDTEFDIRAGLMRQDGFPKVDTRPARSFRTGCASSQYLRACEQIVDDQSAINQ